MMANAVLQASNITTPNGNLTLCYDEMGDCYKVPEYCFVDPIELGANDRDRVPASNGLFKGFMMTSTSAKSQHTTTPQIVDTPLTVKIKINPSDYLLHVDTNLVSTVEELKQTLYNKTKAMREKQGAECIPPLCDERRQRMIFMGKELKPGQVLGDVGIDDTRVIQVFLRKEEADQTVAC